VVELRADGTLVRAFGREGSGPGELLYPIYLDLAGERIWISDVGNRRFSIFDREGSLVGDRKWPGGARIVEPFRVLSTGDVLQGGSWPLTVAELARQDPIYYLARFDLGDTPAAALGQGVTDTLLTAAAPAYLAVPMRSVDGREQNPFFGYPPFSPELHWDSDGERVVTATGERYRFEIRDLDGRILRRVEVSSPELPVTDRHRRWYWENQFPLRFFGSDPYEPSTDSKARLPFAERRPAIGGLALDRDGQIWVQASQRDVGTSRLDIFSGEGRYVGSLPDLPVPVAFTSEGMMLIRELAADGLDHFRVLQVLF